jgi:hypothetical protein
MKIRTANIKEETPKPLWIKKSLNQAPLLLNQFLEGVSRDVKSTKLLWSASPVKKKESFQTPVFAG